MNAYVYANTNEWAVGVDQKEPFPVVWGRVGNLLYTAKPTDDHAQWGEEDEALWVEFPEDLNSAPIYAAETEEGFAVDIASILQTLGAEANADSVIVPRCFGDTEVLRWIVGQYPTKTWALVVLRSGGCTFHVDLTDKQSELLVYDGYRLVASHRSSKTFIHPMGMGWYFWVSGGLFSFLSLEEIAKILNAQWRE